MPGNGTWRPEDIHGYGMPKVVPTVGAVPQRVCVYLAPAAHGPPEDEEAWGPAPGESEIGEEVEAGEGVDMAMEPEEA